MKTYNKPLSQKGLQFYRLVLGSSMRIQAVWIVDACFAYARDVLEFILLLVLLRTFMDIFAQGQNTSFHSCAEPFICVLQLAFNSMTISTPEKDLSLLLKFYLKPEGCVAYQTVDFSILCSCQWWAKLVFFSFLLPFLVSKACRNSIVDSLFEFSLLCRWDLVLAIFWMQRKTLLLAKNMLKNFESLLENRHFEIL